MDKTVEYILEVARCGGIAKAARNLCITPSALSKFIIRKEEELGVTLFLRQGNHFSLTLPGERYVEMLRQLDTRQREIHSEMRRLADLYNGRLRIGFQMSLAEWMTRHIVPAMQDQYPEIHMVLEESSVGELERQLLEDSLDIVLCLTNTDNDALQYDCIYTSPVVIAAAKNSPPAKAAVLREGFSFPWLSDDAILAEKPVLDRNAASFRRYAGYLLDGKTEYQRSDVTVTNARTALMCVAQDLGIIVIPELLVKALHFEEEVELYSFGAEEQYTRLCVICNPAGPQMNKVSAFTEIVREFCPSGLQEAGN